MIKGDPDQIAYGDRSQLRQLGTHRSRRQALTRSFRARLSRRDAAPGFGGRDHAILAPLRRDDPWCLHADIDPREHRLMIHGMVDRPLTFTMEDLKRLPSVTRLHFMECAGNRASPKGEDRPANARDDELRRMDRRAPVLLLKECGVKSGATWFVAEGSEEVKGASSIPLAKAMDDCLS